MTETLRQYGLKRVTGDNYAADFVAKAFKEERVFYIKSDKNKSLLYLEALPRLCSSEIELLDNDVLVLQLSSLERRTRSGGRDVVDHPPGPSFHDDLANVLAGVATQLSTPKLEIGAL